MKARISRICAALVVLLHVTTGWAADVELGIVDDFEAASRLANSGNHEIAIEIFQQCSKKDDARCHFALGTYYYFGDGGFDIDMARALELFERGANRGYGPAEYMLALMYRDGNGVNADIQKALAYLNNAAIRCVPQAQEDLGEYLKGRGQSDSLVDAAAWYAMAASHGSETAAQARQQIVDAAGEDLAAEIDRKTRELEQELMCPD